MALLFGVCFFLYFLKLSAGKGFYVYNKFLVRLHGEYNISLSLWKHHVIYYCKAFDP